MMKYFDFEKDIEKIDEAILSIDSGDKVNIEKLSALKSNKQQNLKKIYSSLNAWQKVQVARHADRPHTLDYINNIFENFIPLCGDKKFADDLAIVGGLAKIDKKSVMLLGTEKGNSMESRIKHNFGMAKPEGYRKAQRLMKIAEKFNLPVITFVDTPGAFPGKDAEERGQSESIASTIAISLKVKIPIISVIIGEGGSGGAIALATADRILMLEHAIYSVISPEGCASILWRNTEYTQQAAETLKLTANDCYSLKIIDEIIPELPGAAHRFPFEQASVIKKTLVSNLQSLRLIEVENLIKNRNKKYLNITSNI